MTELIRCIYCNGTDELTKSDIVPDAITKAKCFNKNVCKKCNNLTNTLHEQKFAMDFSFIRNKLGYTSRRNGAPVPYKMEIWVNEEPGLRKKPSFRKNFYNLKRFVREELIIATDGSVAGFKNAPLKYKSLSKPIIQYLYKINYKTLFFSNSAIRTIAKIGYEWHCKTNHINRKMSRYKEIRKFILENSRNNYVEIIEDPVFEKHTKHFFSYGEGDHALFEYTDNNKRYIIFSLFGIVWYRIFICNEYSGAVAPKEMHQFLLDKEIKVHKSNATSIDVFGKQEIISNFFLQPVTLKIGKIRVAHTKLWEEKLTILLTQLIVTYHEVARLIKTIDDDGILEKCDSRYFIDLLNYQESRRIMAIVILYCLDGFDYDINKPFVSNLKQIEDKISHILLDAKTFIEKNIKEQSIFVGFLKKLNEGKKVFDSIPPAS